MPAGIRCLFIICLFLTACSAGKREHPDKSVFRLNEASGITSLDPAFAKDQANIWACLQLYNGLVELDEKLNVQPAIASSWEISADGLNYIFHLRQDVLFQKVGSKEGVIFPARQVKAEDFVFSFNRLTDPKVASPGAWVMNAVEKNPAGLLTGVSAVDDSTVHIRLSQAFPPFLALLSMPYCSVIPAEVVDHFGTDFRRNPCGTGPFRFSYWKEGVKLIFLKNENYFETFEQQRLPFLDAVEIRFINDKQSAFLEFLKGRLDFLSGLDPSYKDELLTRSGELQERYLGKFKLETEPYLNTEYLGFLMEGSMDKNNPLLNKNVRKALSYGFDRQKMITYMRNNMGTPGQHGFVPPGLPSFRKEAGTGYSYDPEKAGALLKEAGFPEGKGLPEITLSTTSAYLDLCEYIRSQWEELGIHVRIDVNQAAIHRKMVAEQKLNFFRGSWIADYPDAENYLSLFYSKNFAPAGPNYTHYSNPEFDAVYERSSKETVDSIRYELYRKMDQLVMEDAPVIILYYDKVLRLTQSNIHGMSSNAMNLLILKKVRKTQ